MLSNSSSRWWCSISFIWFCFVFATEFRWRRTFIQVVGLSFDCRCSWALELYPNAFWIEQAFNIQSVRLRQLNEWNWRKLKTIFAVKPIPSLTNQLRFQFQFLIPCVCVCDGFERQFIPYCILWCSKTFNCLRFCFFEIREMWYILMENYKMQATPLCFAEYVMMTNQTIKNLSESQMEEWRMPMWGNEQQFEWILITGWDYEIFVNNFWISCWSVSWREWGELLPAAHNLCETIKSLYAEKRNAILKCVASVLGIRSAFAYLQVLISKCPSKAHSKALRWCQTKTTTTTKN